MLCRFCRITGGFCCSFGDDSGSLSCFSALLCSFCGTFGSLRIRFRLCSFIFRGFSGVFGFNSRCLCSHSPLFSQFGLVCCLVGVLCRLSCRGLGLFCYITGVFGLGLCCFSLGFGSLRRGIGINCLIFCVYGIGFGILRGLCRLRGLGFGCFGITFSLLSAICIRISCRGRGCSSSLCDNSGCLCGLSALFGYFGFGLCFNRRCLCSHSTFLCSLCISFGCFSITFGLFSAICIGIGRRGRGCSSSLCFNRSFFSRLGTFLCRLCISFGLLSRGIGINCIGFCSFG